jgi:hypothetical protein
MSETPTVAYCYIRNPDVVLREEDEDGALLFNPDTNQVKVLNSTGLFIWERCDGIRSLQSIIDELKGEFSQVPLDELDKHVDDFLTDLKQSGFIGTSESGNG